MLRMSDLKTGNKVYLKPNNFYKTKGNYWCVVLSINNNTNTQFFNYPIQVSIPERGTGYISLNEIGAIRP